MELPCTAGASLPGRHSNSPISACLAAPVCPASPASPAVSDPCFPPFRLPKKPKFLNPYGPGHAPPLKTRTHARNGTCSPPSQSGFAPLIGVPSREGVCRIFYCECRISTAMVIPEAVPRPVFDTMLFSVIQYGGARSWPIEVNLPGTRRERTVPKRGFVCEIPANMVRVLVDHELIATPSSSPVTML